MTALLTDAATLTVQFDVEGESPEQFANNCATLAGVLNMFPKNQVILAVGHVDGLDVIGAYRILAATFDNRGLVLPILLRDRIDRTGRDRRRGDRRLCHQFTDRCEHAHRLVAV